jgi:hypothetical protein
MIPHYFYIYNISLYDFNAIQTTGANIYIFTTETPYKFSSRTLLPPSLRTGKFTVECPCPEPFRHTPGEYRYFQRFQTKTAFHLSGFYEPGLWNRVILQASELQESIRHAVIALGALDMTTSRMTETESSPGSTSSPQERIPAAETYHIFALKQYSKAIKQMREQSLNSKHDLRTALVASLLIITFETYHVNYASAGDQIRTAIRLIEERSSSSSSPPPENEVEEDILFAFNRLAIQEISHTDGFTLAEHLTLKETNSSRIRDMPEVFTDITTARGYFNMIARQCAHFGCAFWMSDNALSNKPSLALFDRTQTPSQSMAPDLLKQLGHDGYVDLCVRFLRAFNPLYQSTTPNLNLRERRVKNGREMVRLA